MPRHFYPLEAGKRTHPDIVKLREQERIDKVAAIDCELRVIDSLLRDLQSRGTRAKKAATASPIEFGFQLLRAGDKQRQMYAKQIVTFDYVRIAFFDESGKSPERISFGFFYVVRIDDD